MEGRSRRVYVPSAHRPSAANPPPSWKLDCDFDTEKSWLIAYRWPEALLITTSRQYIFYIYVNYHILTIQEAREKEMFFQIVAKNLQKYFLARAYWKHPRVATPRRSDGAAQGPAAFLSRVQYCYGPEAAFYTILVENPGPPSPVNADPDLERGQPEVSGFSSLPCSPVAQAELRFPLSAPLGAVLPTFSLRAFTDGWSSKSMSLGGLTSKFLPFLDPKICLLNSHSL